MRRHITRMGRIKLVYVVGRIRYFDIPANCPLSWSSIARRTAAVSQLRGRWSTTRARRLRPCRRLPQPPLAAADVHRTTVIAASGANRRRLVETAPGRGSFVPECALDFAQVQPQRASRRLPRAHARPHVSRSHCPRTADSRRRCREHLNRVTARPMSARPRARLARLPRRWPALRRCSLWLFVRILRCGRHWRPSGRHARSAVECGRLVGRAQPDALTLSARGCCGLEIGRRRAAWLPPA